jgi:hypothetical protein
MAMTDRKLCEAVLGWTQYEDNEDTWDTDGTRMNLVKTPGFAYDIEWAMKLARAVRERYGLTSQLVQSPANSSTMTFKHPMSSTWSGGSKAGTPEDAIRAAVVKVCEAHEPKGESDA